VGQRLVNRPADDFNLTQFNYLQVHAERWMLNAFTHYEFAPKATGYMEFHFSNNRVDQQLTQANIGGDFRSTPTIHLDANMRATLVALDAAKRARGRCNRSDRVYDHAERRLAIHRGTPGGLPFRHNVDDHNVWRMALGARVISAMPRTSSCAT
jgi:hypothetical protein